MRARLTNSPRDPPCHLAGEAWGGLHGGRTRMGRTFEGGLDICGRRAPRRSVVEPAMHMSALPSRDANERRLATDVLPEFVIRESPPLARQQPAIELSYTLERRTIQQAITVRRSEGLSRRKARPQSKRTFIFRPDLPLFP